jgi:spore photoproduct lyase
MQRKTKIITKYDFGHNIVFYDQYVISFGTSCSLNCEYCYLKYSKTPNIPVVYKIHHSQLEKELEELFSCDKKIFYFNAGETTEPFLSEEHWENLCKTIQIISNIAKKHNVKCFVELRTKTNNIIKFKTLPIQNENIKIVYSATLSPQEVINNFEKNTASLKERIDALNHAAKLGFFISINFEPIIFWPVLGIQKKKVLHSLHILINNYKQIINQVTNIFEHKNFFMLNLSCLRLTKQQFKILLDKKSKLCFFEMFLCEDGKFRYSRPIRVTIYNELINFVKSLCPGTENKIFLSFEFDYIWQACGLKIFDNFSHFLL